MKVTIFDEKISYQWVDYFFTSALIQKQIYSFFIRTILQEY